VHQLVDVIELRDRAGLLVAAVVLAGAGLLALRGLGGGLRFDPLAPVVAQRGDRAGLLVAAVVRVTAVPLLTAASAGAARAGSGSIDSSISSVMAILNSRFVVFIGLSLPFFGVTWSTIVPGRGRPPPSS